jgi:hypothetical protein
MDVRVGHSLLTWKDFKNKCYRRILKISYLEHKTMSDKVITYAGNHEHLLTVVKRHKIACFGHVNRHIHYQRLFCRTMSTGFGGSEVNKKVGLTTMNGQNAAFLN